MPPKTIIVFGPVGSGKSTIANALLSGSVCWNRVTSTNGTGVQWNAKNSASWLGNRYPYNLFPVGDGVNTCTTNCLQKNDHNWIIIDTPGILNADPNGLSNPKVAEKVKSMILSLSNKKFHYILITVKRCDIGPKDEIVYSTVSRLFKGEGLRNVILVVTHTGGTALSEDERNSLRSLYTFVHRGEEIVPPILDLNYIRPNTVEGTDTFSNDAPFTNKLARFLDGLNLDPHEINLSELETFIGFLISRSKSFIMMMSNMSNMLFPSAGWRNIVRDFFLVSPEPPAHA